MIPKALRVRLPLLLAVGAGVWLWQSNLFAQSRELVVRAPRAQKLTVQLTTVGGELLWQTDRTFPAPEAAEIRQELALRNGRYVALMFATDEHGLSRQDRRTVDLGDERTLQIDLLGAPVASSPR